MILIDHVTGRQGHLIQITDIPCVEQHSAAGGVGPERFHQSSDLVMLAPLGIDPAPPLLAIDRAKFAPLAGKFVIADNARFKVALGNIFARGLTIAGKRPVAPDTDILVEQIAYVGAAGKEPQHLFDGGFPIYAFGGDYGDLTAAEVKSQQLPE